MTRGGSAAIRLGNYTSIVWRRSANLSAGAIVACSCLVVLLHPICKVQPTAAAAPAP